MNTIDSKETKKCCCSTENQCCLGSSQENKQTHRNEADKKKLINRLSRIEGQIRGLKNMIAEDAYCPDILTQAAAASSAMNSFSREVLSAHVHSCVIRDIQNGEVEVVDELMELLSKMMK